MQKDLEKFENRSDDWLAKQRAHEARVSAWDLDDARKLKIEHETRHQEYNRIQNIRYEEPETRSVPNAVQRKKAATGIALVAVAIYLIAMFLVIFLTSM